VVSEVAIGVNIEVSTIGRRDGGQGRKAAAEVVRVCHPRRDGYRDNSQVAMRGRNHIQLSMDPGPGSNGWDDPASDMAVIAREAPK